MYPDSPAPPVMRMQLGVYSVPPAPLAMLPLSARLTPETVPLTAFMLGVQSWPKILGLAVVTKI